MSDLKTTKAPIQRDANLAMSPIELGTARQTRHSFARSLVRVASAQGWKVSTRIWNLDSEGKGLAVYNMQMGEHCTELVIFSQVISEEMRTDRVIALDWDVTAALVDGQISDEGIEILRGHVTQQEYGRADNLSLIWARANRSQRFFDYIVNQLADGKQPKSSEVSDAAYILRSTAFYGNGKWGLRDFEGIDNSHPLGVPYRAQMLAAWLLREFSADLVEHCAKAKSAAAKKLSSEWRRFLGLGNATGLGMVPYVIRHPQVLHAWVTLRELPLAHALTQAWGPKSPQTKKVIALLERAQKYFSEKLSFSTDPYPTGPEIAGGLNEVISEAKNFQKTGQLSNGGDVLAVGLHRLASEQSVELRQVIDSILVEVDDSLDQQIQTQLLTHDRTKLDPAMGIAELRLVIERNYSWVANFNFDDSAETGKFWFYSRNKQEPRRGTRGKDPGLHTEHPVGIAREVTDLNRDLAGFDGGSVADFLIKHPKHWGIVERIQSTKHLEYAEAHVNPLSDNFLPLDLQRFQLACYGMENFNPQSTDWLRVTLFSGAPSCKEIGNLKKDDDWLFMPKPEGV